MTKQNDRRRNAQAPVEALEALSLGEPFATAAREAQTAVEALERDAAEVLFQVRQVGGDTTIDLEYNTRGFSRQRFTREAVDLHERSLSTHPRLAEAMRSTSFLARVRQEAALRARGLNRVPEELAVQEAQFYMRAIASQLHARKLDEPHSEVLGVLVPELEARVVAAKQRHEAHAAAELARQEAEQLRVLAVLAQERRADRQRLADQVRALPASVSLTVTGELGGITEVSARTAAMLLLHEDATDQLVESIRRQLEPFMRVAERARA